MIPQEEIEVPVSLSLAPYTGPWTKDQAAHLLRRTLFGATFQQIQDAAAAGMNASVTQLLTTPVSAPPVAFNANDGVAPIGSTWVQSVYPASNTAASENARRESLAAWVIERINLESLSIHEKMCLFWQNHFAAEFTFDSRASYNYINLIRTHALGNFKQFVKEMTIDPCMLVFLNGASNNLYSPNENFSRELLELYSIGKGPQIGEGDYSTYKEEDVLAGAKILTGWTIQGFNSTVAPNTSAIFIPGLHDTTTKTLSEHFGNATVPDAGDQEYANYIDIIFQQPELATFICRKIYRWFVNYDLTQTVEDTVVSELAATFLDNDFEILPVMEQLLPLSDERLKAGGGPTGQRGVWDYIYEPEAKPVIDDIMVRYVEALIYQALTENMASEQSARMVAMKAASDNAGNVIDELTLIYNKSRQAAITKELSEIVGGAAAV